MLVILDRDGVINKESHAYIKHPDEWIPLSGSLQAIARLKQAGHTVVVATNQSGLARDYFTQATLERIHQKMQQALAAIDARVDGIFYCPHHPDDGCVCRKPMPGLLHQIQAQFNHPWQDAIMVGDSLRDIQAAEAVGCRGALVKTGNGESVIAKGVGLANVSVYEDLNDFVSQLLAS